MTFVPPSNQGGFISAPITVDPNKQIQQAIAVIQGQYPGWTPHEGQLDVAIIEEAAQMMSVSAAAATQVPATIFQFFGLLVGIEPITGVQATVPAVITMVDDQGYTITAGTVFAYVQGNAQTLFTVQTTVVIAVGDTTGDCVLVCESVGSFPNGLAGTTFAQVTSFPQIASVISSVAVSGGVDAETATSYMNRLSSELQLLTPRPILPGDFAALAPSVPGVFRALAINGLAPGRTITDGVLNSTTTVTSVSAAFTSIDVGRTVTGTGIASSTVIDSVTNPTTIVLNNAATASGTGRTITFGDLTGQERCVTVCGVDSSGDALSDDVNDALEAYLAGLREVNFLVYTISPTYSNIDVTVTCYAQPGYSTDSVQTAVETALNNYLATATWGGGLDDPPDWQASSNVVPYLAVANAIQSAPGVLYIASGGLTINIDGDSAGTVDLDLPGQAGLPVPNTISVTVNPAP